MKIKQNIVVNPKTNEVLFNFGEGGVVMCKLEEQPELNGLQFVTEDEFAELPEYGYYDEAKDEELDFTDLIMVEIEISIPMFYRIPA
tara:strand:- start:29977 stop:30237 length:261 start_codon:yes stop_codon:yes gene_type:complete